METPTTDPAGRSLGPTNGHLLPLNHAIGKPFLFIIPGLEGKARSYRGIGGNLNTLYEVFGLEMMGLKIGEIPFNSMCDISLQNNCWIRKIQPRGPYRLLAHSFGAYVAYEMIRLFENDGEKVDFIVVLDQDMRCLKGLRGDDMANYLIRLVVDYFKAFKIIDRSQTEWALALKSQLESLSTWNMLLYIEAFMKGKWPKKAHAISRVMRLVSVKFYNSLMVYAPSGKINTKVLLLKAEGTSWNSDDLSLGWSKYSSEVKSYTVPGSHNRMIYNGGARAIARHVRAYIEEGDIE